MLARLIAPITLLPVLLLMLCLQPLSASAQISLTGAPASEPEVVTLPDPLTPETVRGLVARMSDDQVRGMLLDRLDAVAKAQAAPANSQSLMEGINTLWTAFISANVDSFTRIPTLFSKQGEAFVTLGNYYGARGLATLFGLLALSLVAGLIAEFLTGRLTQRWWTHHRPVAENASLRTTLKVLFNRFLYELIGLVAFYAGTTAAALWLMDERQLDFATPLTMLLIFMPRVAASFWRMILAPKRPELRLLSVSDHWAVYLFRHNIGMVFLIGLSFFIVRFNQAIGIPMGETRIGYWLNLAVHLYLIFIVWRAREGLSDMMLGSDPDRTSFDEKIARAYPYFAVLVSISMFVVVNILAGLGMFELMQNAPQYATMFWLLMTPALDTTIRGIVRHLLPPMVGDGAIAEEAYRLTKRGYIKIGRVIVGIFIVLMIADVWQIDLRNLAAAGVGHKFAGRLIEFLMVSAVGYMIYQLVTLWINRKLAMEQTSAEEGDSEAGGEGGGAGGSRLTTVLPLVRVSAQVAITVIFGLVALGALGVDTTPLLAGAGILGLAIGFGAQKLVADIVSGIFFLIDDAFRVGEYVDVGGTMGVVEKISIRSMQLRHHRGLVHTIPYGEIPKLTNFSRDWVIMKLKFTVPFDTDPNKVKKLFKKIGAEMMEDPIHKDGFLEPFKSQGVFEFNDVGMVMRGKFMAKPGAQFTIRKEIYNRVKTELEAAGIPFARREVRVAIPGLEHNTELNDEAKAAIAAAAVASEEARLQQVAAEEPQK